jgi:hypothetical protein
MLINFHFDKIWALRMTFFSEGHAEIFHDNREDRCNQFSYFDRRQWCS